MNKKKEKSIRTMNRSKKAKKIIFTVVTMACLAVCATVNASALTPVTASFDTEASAALQKVVTLIGGGLGVWGVVNLLEGYGNDNPGAKSQGMKQAVAGVGLIIVGAALVPSIFGAAGGSGSGS